MSKQTFLAVFACLILALSTAVRGQDAPTSTVGGSAAGASGSAVCPAAGGLPASTSRTLTIPYVPLRSGGGAFTFATPSASSANGSLTYVVPDPTTYSQGGSFSPGITATESISGENAPLANYQLHTDTFLDGAPGTYTGNVWSGAKMLLEDFTSTSRGIAQLHSSVSTLTGVGDKALDYKYATFFGGMQFYSDEGVEPFVIQAAQQGWLKAKISTGGTKGSTFLKTTPPTCHTSAWGCPGNPPSSGLWWNDGGLVYDQTQAGLTATIASTGRANHVLVANLTTSPLTPSTAWGTQVSCLDNINDNYQNYFSDTCQIKLGAGKFTTGMMAITGAYDEQVEVTAVGTPIGGVQRVTFQTRHNWINNVPNVFMQGGPLGQVIVQDPKWPIAWPVIGAFSGSQLVFGNCRAGICTGAAGGNFPSPGSFTLYPAAEVIGTNGGKQQQMDLATNSVPWANGDTVIGAPVSEYEQNGITLNFGQSTPVDAGISSNGLILRDVGASQAISAILASNNIANGAAYAFLTASGAYNNIFNLNYRPANNGCVICMTAPWDTGIGSNYYYIFRDGGGGTIGFQPGGQGAWNFSGPVRAPMYRETLTTPSSSSAPCTAGQFTDDANYHYVCVATNTWKRAALSSF